MSHRSQLIIFTIIFLLSKSIDTTSKLNKKSWADVVKLGSLNGKLDIPPTSNGHNLKATTNEKSTLEPIPKENSTSIVLLDTTLDSPAISPESSSTSSTSSIGTQSPPHEIEDSHGNKLKSHNEHETGTNPMKKNHELTIKVESSNGELDAPPASKGRKLKSTRNKKGILKSTRRKKSKSVALRDTTLGSSAVPLESSSTSSISNGTQSPPHEIESHSEHGVETNSTKKNNKSTIKVENLNGELGALPTSKRHKLKATRNKKSVLKSTRKKKTRPTVLLDTIFESPSTSPESSTVSLTSSTGVQKGKLDTSPTSNEHSLKTTSNKKSIQIRIRKKNSTSAVLRDTTSDSPAVSPESPSTFSTSSIGTQNPPRGIRSSSGSKAKPRSEHETGTSSIKKNHGFTTKIDNERDESGSWSSKTFSPTKELSSSKVITTIQIDNNSNSFVSSHDNILYKGPDHTQLSYVNGPINYVPTPIYLRPVQPQPLILYHLQPIVSVTPTLNPLNNGFVHQPYGQTIPQESQMNSDLSRTMPMGPLQEESYLTKPEHAHLAGVMSIRFIDDDYALTPYTGYIISANMHTFVFFHEDTVTIIKTHPKMERSVIKISSPIQIIAIADTRLLVLTKDANVLLYDTATLKILNEIEELEIPHEDVLNIHEMILHDNNDFSFKMNGSLYVTGFKEDTTPKKIADDVTILNGRSMFIPFSTTPKQDSEIEKDGVKQQFEKSIEIYDVAKGITKSVLLARSDVRVTASQTYLYIIHNMNLKVYRMADAMIVLSVTVDDLSDQDLVHYNTKNELWVLKKDKNVYKYSKKIGFPYHCYNLNIDNQVVYPNDDWTAFQIGEDLVSLSDLKIARFGDPHDKNAFATQIILPQRVYREHWTQFNGEIALQRTPRRFHIVNTTNGTTIELSTQAKNTNFCLWSQGIYTKTYNYPKATYHFYIGDDTKNIPVYTIHDYDPQNNHANYVKKISAGRILAFITHKAAKSYESHIECFDMSRTDERSPIWNSTNFIMIDVPNSPYIWNGVDKTLVDAYTGHILLNTGHRVTKYVCALKDHLYALTKDQRLLQFAIPQFHSRQHLRHPPNVSRPERNYSWDTIITAFQIRNGDHPPRGLLVLFDRATTSLDVMDLSSMELIKKMNLKLPESFVARGAKAKFSWNMEKFGKRQLWLSMNDADGKFLLFRICEGYMRKYVD